MNRDVLRQILVIVATVATIGLNIMANALPLNGLNTGEISDRFDIYFVPAGYVFSIWFLWGLGSSCQLFWDLYDDQHPG